MAGVMRHIYIPLAVIVVMAILGALAYPAAALGMWMIDHGFSVAASFMATVAAIGIPFGVFLAAILPKCPA
jgi:hypothetical protein